MCLVVPAPLSTVHVPLADIGRCAFEMLWILFSGQTPEPRQVLIEPALVVRDSSVAGASSLDSQYLVAVQTEWAHE